jgi:hypothetical protein
MKSASKLSWNMAAKSRQKRREKRAALSKRADKAVRFSDHERNDNMTYQPEHKRLGVVPIKAPVTEIQSREPEAIVVKNVGVFNREGMDDEDDFDFSDLKPPDVEPSDVEPGNHLEHAVDQFIKQAGVTEEQIRAQEQEAEQDPDVDQEEDQQSMFDYPAGTIMMFVKGDLVIADKKAAAIEQAIDYVLENKLCQTGDIAVFYRMEVKRGTTIF